MRTFRRKGYEATSVKDLERATGLRSGSLHHAFGGKRALFLAALDHYNEHVVGGRIATYLHGDDPVKELRALFRSVLDEPGGGSFGCLLTNTAVEFAGGSKAISAKVREGFAQLEDAFEAQSRRARALGIGAKTGRTHRRTALRLLHAYQGLLVLVRFGHERAELETLVDDLLADVFDGGSS
jgi:AcrR family transcriptional regulator